MNLLCCLHLPPYCHVAGFTAIFTHNTLIFYLKVSPPNSLTPSLISRLNHPLDDSLPVIRCLLPWRSHSLALKAILPTLRAQCVVFCVYSAIPKDASASTFYCLPSIRISILPPVYPLFTRRSHGSLITTRLARSCLLLVFCSSYMTTTGRLLGLSFLWSL